MTKETFNIIMACKKTHIEDGNGDCVSRVKNYLAKETGLKASSLSEKEVNHIMLLTMYDYIDTCDKPSVFLRGIYEDSFREHLSLGERIGRALMMVKVRRDGVCVNGFIEEWLKEEM